MRIDRDYIKRCVLFLTGLFLSALGVAITKKGELGVSPVSSVANVLSIRFDALTLGNWLIVWNCLLIVGQIVILRRKFELFQLLQIPLSFLFGFFTDFGAWMIHALPVGLYAVRLGCVLAGTAVLGFGIALTVKANVIMNSGEAFVKAVSDVKKSDFGKTKIVFDVSCVTLSIILSLLLCGFRIEGTREGTILAALLTGSCVRFFSQRMK